MTVQPARIGNKAPDWGHRYDLRELWTEVLPGLWQGGTHDNDTVDVPRGGIRKMYNFMITEDAEITKDHFDAVVTLYAWARPVDWLVEELRASVFDSPTPSDDEIEQVVDAAAWAHKRWKAGKRVLIRCQAGLNRSSLVTALVMMQEGYTARAAIDKIRRARSHHCLFNFAFEQLLFDMERGTDDRP